MGDTRGGRAPDQWRDFQGLDDRITALERLQQADRYDFLGNFVRSADRTLLTFSNIPQVYKHLRVMFIGQSTRSGFPNTGFRMWFSTAAGLISSGYQMQYMGYSSQTGAFVSGQSPNDSRAYLGQCPAGNRANDNYILSGTVDIPLYAVNNIVTNMMVDSTMHDGSVLFQGLRAHNINNATSAAVTGLQIADDVVGSGSTLGPRAQAQLFGIL